ncbi:alpha-glycosidase [Actinomycetes bacterium]|nr:alpha-glycosidase [Actinomycetes bacterium]
MGSVANFLVPHHDGSELYLSNSAPKLGEKVTFRVRVPNEYKFDQGVMRYYHDGEPRTGYLELAKKGKIESWWEITIPIINPQTKYRFLFAGEGKFDWLSAAGLHNHDVHSNTDFQIIAKPAYPKWLKSSIFYQIFPDRFASSGKKILPKWAHEEPWNSFDNSKQIWNGQEIAGGDLKGVESHLDYLTDLGINGIYFTPLFPSRSNHRYDATSFEEVDPLLGGNTAWFSLRKAADKRGIRLVGDLTSNHCGAGHYWMERAQNSKRAKERGYFYWDKSFKWGYVGWWGLKSLPKLNFASKALRKEMYEGKNSIVKKWLSPKFGMSGWRIDVGNMTGKLGDIDIHDEVMHGIRKAMDEVAPSAWLVAENGDFVAEDLAGYGWHGTMNYQGFMRPIASWMNKGAKLSGGFQGLPIDSPMITGTQLVETIKNFNGSLPWRALTASMVLLDSHDTPRFRTIVSGDRDRHLAAMTMLLTYPGVPSIFMGDEIGLEGTHGDDTRKTIKWDDRSEWDLEFLAEVKKLTAFRRKNDALVNGGLRWVAAEDGHIAYLRESKKSKVLVLIATIPSEIKIDLSKYGYRVAKTLYGKHANGSMINIKCEGATQGIWELK